MAKMAPGYGSEFHLLRYLGRHRQVLDARVMATTRSQDVCWLDSPFDSNVAGRDVEWNGMDFLPEHEPAKAAWQDFWPQSGNVPNWDAVAEITIDGRKEWLLVEAKAHVGELRSSCAAKPAGGLKQIAGVVDAAKQAFGIAPDRDWLTGYYQYCNRLVTLHFLSTHAIAAQLLLIYFTGDRSDPPRRLCPADEAGWMPALKAQAEHVGLPAGHHLADRIHTMFLPVGG